ncbi:WecB/TagA/CpsF family glycosyltransferase [Dethiosulfovibrio salsuginis]|uniref:N-acetylglucosaminyldiphosphoundecaprenol N-acetyl-beta-D-mannosaminyltransferase n=1 Tax=Dethiosulfovibrio salsuginis TaxID=561720 RepID=A0A1X7I6M8_9BACT|nr:WecB/TagA/CpsF family glycosyltransferase [Dethiosulfovibrio salsuginis]SMG09755.1 N-acetylglucosaminyldiphosphoundecaprenol N-acetyl-beta-D-mannosaminyltransferase [Dethiosulfovibrio salsuginis]
MNNVIAYAIFALMGLVVASFFLQKIYRRSLSRERYFYMRDLSLVAGWILFALWSGSEPIKVVVAMATLGAVIGMAQHTSPGKNLSWLLGAVGLCFAAMGPRIYFIGLSNGEYLYLSHYSSFLLTAVWVTLFPLLFQKLDYIPGLAGHLLGVGFSLALLVSSLSGQSLAGGFLMSLAGLSFTAVFWSRLGHNYRQLGRPLAAFWGIIVAGASLVGVSKGVTFTAIMVIPMGLYALPIAEASLSFIAQALPVKGWGRISIYHRMIDKGIDHPKAVKFVTFLCLSIGAIVSFVQMGIDDSNKPILLFILGVSSFVGITCARGARSYRDSSDMWGIPMDGISMNYALSKTRSRIINLEPSAMVVTANALSLYRTRKDPIYRDVVKRSWLTLPDGAGLVWAMRLLGVPVVERVAGIDFMHGLSRLSAAEGWPVYLLGSKPGVADEAGRKLTELYPGLVVAGSRDGYFSEEEDLDVVQEIKDSGAKVLFVALGMPKQDVWLDKYLPDMDGVVGVGVGGSLDVVSGRLKRAPAGWQKIGMEWLYRLIQEPKRLRQDLDLGLFVLMVLLEKIGLGDGDKKDEKLRS